MSIRYFWLKLSIREISLTIVESWVIRLSLNFTECWSLLVRLCILLFSSSTRSSYDIPRKNLEAALLLIFYT